MKKVCAYYQKERIEKKEVIQIYYSIKFLPNPKEENYYFGIWI